MYVTRSGTNLDAITISFFLSFFFFLFLFFSLNIKCSAPHLWQTLDLDNSFVVYLFNVGPNTLLSMVISMLDYDNDKKLNGSQKVDMGSGRCVIYFNSVNFGDLL